MAGDDHLLDLAGPLVNPEEPGVTEEPLDGDPAHVAGAPVDLHGAVRHAPHHFAAEVLGGRRPHLAVGAVVEGAGGGQDQAAPGLELGHRVGDEALNELEGGDRVPGLLARPGVLHRLVHQPLGHADAQGGDVNSPVGQAPHGGGPPGVVPGLFADQGGGRHPHVVKVDVGGPGPELAHFVVARPDGEPGGSPRDQKGRDAPGRPGGRVGPGEHHEDIRQRRIGDVALGPVDDPLVPVADRGGRQARWIRTGVGLGEGKGSHGITRGDFGQPLLLLGRGAPLHQHVPGNAVVGAEHRTERRCGVPELDHNPAFLFHRQAQPAVDLGQREPEETHLLGGLADVGGDFVALVDLVLHGNHGGAHEIPHHRADPLEILAVHALSPLLRSHARCGSRTLGARPTTRPVGRCCGRNRSRPVTKGPDRPDRD